MNIPASIKPRRTYAEQSDHVRNRAKDRQDEDNEASPLPAFLLLGAFCLGVWLGIAFGCAE